MKVEEVLPGAPAPESAPAPEPEPAPEAGTVSCGFCKSLLTQSKGQVLEMSPKAIAYRDTELVIRDLRRDLRNEQEKRKTAEDERDVLKPKPAEGSKTPGQDRW